MSDKEPLIVWSDPPKRSRGWTPDKLKYGAHCQAVMKRTNKWACVQRSPTPSPLYSAATSIRTGKAYARLAASGRFEVRVRRTDSGDFGLWLRYIPPGENP